MATPRVLWVVNQTYWPDVAATGQLLADLAEDAARRGWDVRVVTSREPYASPTRTPYARRETRRGVGIVRLAGPALGRGLLGRAVGYAWFLVAAGFRLLRVRRGHVVLALSTPPFVALLGLLAKRRRARFVYKVEDLYPDVAVALGVVRPGGLQRVLARLSARLLRRADAVVVLDEAMGETVARLRGHGERLEVIANWADGEAVRPVPASTSRTRAGLALPDGTVLLVYAGNFGRAHTFDALLEALGQAERERLPIATLFSGGGAQAALVKQGASKLASVTVQSYVPREDLSDVLAAADVHVITLKPEVDGLLAPSKLAGALAAGRPVLAIARESGALAREVETGRLGWTASPEPASVLAALRAVVAERHQLGAWGERARAWFEARYDRATQCERWCELLDAVRAPAVKVVP
ncbi:MAG: glycosyltransferase family 4 protein [Planctomycetes bacterium]|nr:glycosyltransferase family 4 protein [Planctomycetota bacterium]